MNNQPFFAAFAEARTLPPEGSLDMVYHEVHFSIDESGNLADTANQDILLVGGILLFGRYDATAEQQLATILREEVQKVGGEYPRDLHSLGEPRKISFQKLEKVLRALKPRLKGWAGKECELFGISSRHRKDAFPEPHQELLEERKYDNRYIAMLSSLLEHLLFVDRKIAQRLTKDALVNLHIANRAFIFDPLQLDPNELIRLGYHPYEITKGKNQGKYQVDSILREGDLRSTLREMIRQRWPGTTFRVGSIKVQPIGYRPQQKRTPLLYLADLYLAVLSGRFRHQQQPQYNPQLETLIVERFRDLDYSPWLDLLAEMQCDLEKGNLEHYLRVSTSCANAPADVPKPYIDLRKRQEREAVDLLVREPSALRAFLERTSRSMDEPGGASEGHRLLPRVERLAKASKDVQAEVLLLQTRLAHANHTGDTARAEEVWNEYRKVEKKLGPLSWAGFRLAAEVRNRRAVSLTDRFLYTDAAKVLSPLIERQKGIWKELHPKAEAQFFELGACLGTRGQIHAFHREFAKAEECFRDALKHFTEKADLERQWVYLGHLACDLGEPDGRPLWEEVVKALPQLGSKYPYVHKGGQFVLALQIKGRYVFATPPQRRSFLQRWESQQPINRFPTESRRQIPFGLIQQAVAMNYARVWENGKACQDADKALDYFATAFMEVGCATPLLKILSHVCALRRGVFALEVNPQDHKEKQLLSQTLKVLEGLLDFPMKKGGATIDPVERARCVMQAIYFNYW